jgi:hypothetical protein
MSDDATVTGVQVPADTQARFADMVELILASESMNEEEKQYWITILPVMTEEQMKNLRDILEGERAQLQAIDEKYAAQMTALGTQASLDDIEKKMKMQKEQRTEQETAAEQEEREREEALLSQIEQL